MQDDALDADLNQLARLLHKYRHGQATVVEEIRATLSTPTPDFQRLAGIDMWGGSGAVWEVDFAPFSTSSEAHADKIAFHQNIIRIAEHMDRLKIGTERSRYIAGAFREWMRKGIVYNTLYATPSQAGHQPDASSPSPQPPS